jgi:hypothetical protein
MYELTASETVTILSVLARSGESSNTDPEGFGIPTSTFYSTRRKVYDSGWLTDRYVPEPWSNGISSMDCLVAVPGPSERARVEEEWASSVDNVVLWAGPNVLFGIFFRRGGDLPDAVDAKQVSVTPSRGFFPVYFDFSRPWSRFVRLEKPTGYPRSLGGVASSQGPIRNTALIEKFYVDPAADTPPTRGGRWHSPSALPRNRRALLQQGSVRSRSFLNIEVLPPYEGRILGEIVFLTGRLKEGRSSIDVLSALNAECQVSPILLGDDGTNLVLLALGQIEASENVRKKIPRATGNVVSTLSTSLSDLWMIIERAHSVLKIVDHRYERVFASKRPPHAEESR